MKLRQYHLDILQHVQLNLSIQRKTKSRVSFVMETLKQHYQVT